ncbi:unnamed protein product [Laminaria digitata]
MGPTPAAAAAPPRRRGQQRRAPAAPSGEKRDKLYAQLVEMGFATADCDRAFREVGYEIEPVLNWLFAQS